MLDATFSSANSRNAITVNNRLCGSTTAAKYRRVGEERDSRQPTAGCWAGRAQVVPELDGPKCPLMAFELAHCCISSRSIVQLAAGIVKCTYTGDE